MKKLGILVIVLIGFAFGAIADERGNLLYPEVVKKVYLENGGRLVWCANSNEAVQLRFQLLTQLDSATKYKFISQSFHRDFIVAHQLSIDTDSVLLWSTEYLFADAAIALIKETWAGYKQSPWVGYDAVSAKYKEMEFDFLVSKLRVVRSAESIKKVLNEVESGNAEYVQLKKNYLKKFEVSVDSADKLLHAMNLVKWVHHFGLSKLILINVAAAKLYYFENGKLQLQMKTVVGKPKTPSPLFAAWCSQAILYPYWYVPSSILFGELLSKIKRNPSWLDANNMQVVDVTGRVLNHHALNWSSFHAGYFPYTLRQSTGCDNSLGVIKFNIETPYGVYLHDTNNKNAFLSESRFYSHGCIRLEDPIELAQKLLKEGIDTAYLNSCFKDQTPHIKIFKESVAVFAVYLPAYPINDNAVKFYKDIYRLSAKAHNTK